MVNCQERRVAGSAAALAERRLVCPCPLACPIQRARGPETGPALPHLVRSSTAALGLGVKQGLGWRKEAIERGAGEPRGPKTPSWKLSGVDAYHLTWGEARKEA